MDCDNLHEGFSAFIRLDPKTLNDQLMEIGVWVVERSVAHKVRVSFQPGRERVCFEFPSTDEVQAFAAHFRLVVLIDDVAPDALRGRA